MSAKPIKYSSASRGRVPSIESPTTVWDHLAVPETLDELVMMVEDWKDCNMFFPMPGIPRAYFEIPTGFGDEAESDIFPVARFVYYVIGFRCNEPQVTAEKKLCAAIWNVLKEARKTLHVKHPDYDTPVLFWRRGAEISESPPVPVGPCFEHDVAKCGICARDHYVTRMTVRVAIPGHNLGAVAAQDSVSLEVIP